MTIQYDGRQIKYKRWKWISIILLGCITLSKYIHNISKYHRPQLSDISNAAENLSYVSRS